MVSPELQKLREEQSRDGILYRPARYEIMFSFEGNDVIIPNANLQAWVDTKVKLIALTNGQIKFAGGGRRKEDQYIPPSAFVEKESTATFILTAFRPYVRGILDWQEIRWLYMA